MASQQENQMKLDTKKRNRRLRKKLRVDEYQELGFDVSWLFNKDITGEEINDFIDKFVDEVIEPNQLGFGGQGGLLWQGLVCTKKIGKCTDDHRNQVEAWLNANGVTDVKVTGLYDVWWSM